MRDSRDRKAPRGAGLQGAALQYEQAKRRVRVLTILMWVQFSLAAFVFVYLCASFAAYGLPR